jgi:hypothetical protein
MVSQTSGCTKNLWRWQTRFFLAERLDAPAFNRALSAILIGTDKEIADWKEPVQTAYNRLPKSDQLKVYQQMLGFYHSAN